jgi:hypothetical protein
MYTQTSPLPILCLFHNCLLLKLAVTRLTHNTSFLRRGSDYAVQAIDVSFLPCPHLFSSLVPQLISRNRTSVCNLFVLWALFDPQGDMK